VAHCLVRRSAGQCTVYQRPPHVSIVYIPCMPRKRQACSSAMPSQDKHDYSQHRDVAKDALQRLVEDIAHLVFEILRCHERVEQVAPIQPT
jgi:hypothetical protein